MEQEIINLFKNPKPEGVRVIKDSFPIPFFGQYKKAGAATISLNPSDQEFLEKNGLWLLGDKKRFESYKSLNCFNYTDITSEMLQKAFICCNEYFNRPTAYWTWFRPLENTIKEASNGKYSYRNGTMAHFDLSPWATQPKWSDLTDMERSILKKEGVHFLKWLLSNTQANIIFLNGRTTCETIIKTLNDGRELKWEHIDSTKLSFCLEQISVSGKEIMFIGWNIYIQRGGQNEILKQLKKKIGDEN
jgi:hypothetical protein